MDKKELDLLPNIYEYEESLDYEYDCVPYNIDLMVERIHAKEHLDKDLIRLIIIKSFNEIRNRILINKRVSFVNVGRIKSVGGRVYFFFSKNMKKIVNDKYKQFIK